MIKKRFAYHKPSPEAVNALGAMREAFSSFEDFLLSQLPNESRERSLALTKLEECALFANKAITHNDPGSVQDSDAIKLSGDATLGLTPSARGDDAIPS